MSRLCIIIRARLLIILISLLLFLNGPAQSCLPEGIIFQSQEQIDSFQINYPNCTSIEGDVSIGEYGGVTDITNLNGLSVLDSIGGVLNIWYNNSLINLTGFDNLISVGRLLIMNNDALNSFTGLEGLSAIGGDLWISDNNALISLTGLENVTLIGGNILIRYNPVLTNLDGLNKITTIENNISIYDNYNLDNLAGLSHLTYIGGNLYIGWIGITCLTGLEGLMSIGEVLAIEDNYHLTSLAGLENLTSVGSISISNNNSLPSLNGLNGIALIPGSLTILNNDDMTSLTGLEDLTYIGEYLYISDNDTLFSLSGLENLTAIGGWLSIQRNYTLTILTALNNLNSISGDLNINLNNALTSLVGLDNIAAGSITNLTITNNNALSTCEVQGICNYLASPGGIVEIYHNATGCNGPPEIAGGCDIHLPCLPYGNYHFSTQSEIDSFQIDYPDCPELEGDVTISGNDVTKLIGLNSVVRIGGELHISENDILVNLTGLNNLTSIGGSLFFNNNDALTSLTGLVGLTTVGNNLFIGYGEGNPSLNDLTGLINLTSIGGDLQIYFNNALKSLSGLDNIAAGSISDLGINYNSNLSACEIKNICEYLAIPGVYSDIGSNLAGCNSEEEILAACEVGMSENNTLESHINIYPNPSPKTIKVESSENIEFISLYNSFGELMLKKKVDEKQLEIPVLAYPAGVYMIRVETDREVISKKVMVVH